MLKHSAGQSPYHLQVGRTQRRPWLLLFVVAALSCTVWPAPQPVTTAQEFSQYDVEAAYLFNFAKFVTWPATPLTQNGAFNICVFGDDPFGPSLDRIISGEKIDGKTVVDKKISSPEEAPACSILYISSSEASRLHRVLSVVKDAPILTVSDIPDFTQRGGIIQFVLRDNRVRFEVNLVPVQRDRLTLSSELLKVAVSVKRGEGSR